jgi:formamidopyrimidine-DNA glycosylase
MFELPEYVILAGQMNEALQGRTVQRGVLGNSPHKFVWYNRTHEEFEALTRGKKVGEAVSRGRWLFLALEPGFVLVLGECGGRVLYHAAGSEMPKRYHLCLTFEDASFFTVTTRMWGAMELYAQGEERKRQYVRDMRPTPVDDAFTFEYFDGLIRGLEEKKSVKGLLTQDQLIPGLGNAIAQDIMFRARLHPKLPANGLSQAQKRKLHGEIRRTARDVIARGGRYDEYDLYGKPGGYVRLMDRNAAGNPCPECGTTVMKIQYLGGACYFCPSCQA